jgi:imidazolonepropionase-like amidohydrolase
MPFEAGTAVAFGLPADVALRACTLTTAEIYGVDGEVGSIDVGKRADIIVVDRDPLQATSNVITMFINGKPVDVEDNKHTQLYKRYQRRIADEPR